MPDQFHLKFRRRLIGAGIAAVGAAVVLYMALFQVFLAQEVTTATNRAEFFAVTIKDGLRRLVHLPFVIASDAVVATALGGNGVEELNPLLTDFATRAQAEAIYVMDVNGLTIASSNFQDAISFIGQHYKFRPYFLDAMAGKRGRFFAIGATTGRPGYFVSDAVQGSNGQIIGAVVVKIGLSELNRSWRDSGEQILVTNQENIVLLSSEDSSLYGTLSQLSEISRAQIASQQQFADQQLKRLDWQQVEEGRVRFGGVDYLHATALIKNENWTLHLLVDLAAVRKKISPCGGGSGGGDFGLCHFSHRISLGPTGAGAGNIRRRPGPFRR